MLRRVRATNKQRRHSRAAKQSDYDKMAAAATAVVMNNRGIQYRSGNPEYVLFKFPFWVTFENDFPKGYIVEKTLSTNTYKINAVKLLNWLHARGYCSYDVRKFTEATRHYERMANKIERELNEYL